MLFLSFFVPWVFRHDDASAAAPPIANDYARRATGCAYWQCQVLRAGKAAVFCVGRPPTLSAGSSAPESWRQASRAAATY